MKFIFVLFVMLIINPLLILAQSAKTVEAIEHARNYLARNLTDSALCLADSGVALSTKNSDSTDLIKALGLKGKALIIKENFADASDILFRALDLTRPGRDDQQKAFLFDQIAYMYLSQQHPKEAKYYYEKEYDIRKALGLAKGINDCLLNIAAMCRDLQQLDSSTLFLNKIGNYLTGPHDSSIDGFYYTDRGVLQQTLGNNDSAMHYYKKAYLIWNRQGNQSQLFRPTFNLGFLESQKGNPEEALKYYNVCLSSAMKYGRAREKAHILGTIAEAYGQKNDFKKAYNYLHDYATLSDSLNESDFSRYVIRLDKEFQTEKNKEIIGRQLLQIERAKWDIQNSNNQKWIAILAIIIVALILGCVVVYYKVILNIRRKIDAAKNSFFENVVHEIRTPLAMVHAPVQVLIQGESNSETQQLLYTIERNIKRLSALTDQMLTAGAIDSGKYTLHFKAGLMQECLDRIVESIRPVSDLKNLKLICQFDVTSEIIYYDEDALEKIITNLLTNAIKYTAEGGSIGLDVIGSGENGCYGLRITVWDTGIGINPNDQKRIFERFYRGNKKGNQDQKGMGIGLSLVKSLASRMDGTIEVESEEGKGAVFVVKLKLIQKNDFKQVVQTHQTTDKAILLVDDDLEILNFCNSLLSRSGYSVEVAADGLTAIKKLNEILPDLVITDLRMPGIDGLELTRVIRDQPFSQSLPVIILSARNSSAAKAEAANSGATVYLEKPFDPQELLAVVKNILSIKGSFKAQSPDKNEPDAEKKTLEEKLNIKDPFSKACYDLVIQNLSDNELTVEKLADLMFINRSHFQRKIKSLTGFSPSEIIRAVRLEKAMHWIQTTNMSLSDVCFDCGFSSQSYFTKCFTEYHGFPPGKVTKAIING